MRKFILVAIIGSFVIISCSDNAGSGPGESESVKEYYYRVDVPEGFSADIIYYYHENPDSIQKGTDLIEKVRGIWETDTYSINPLSRTPDADMRIRKTRKIDYTQDISGQLRAQLFVDGKAVIDTTWQLPAGNGSFSIHYNFANN